MASYLAIQIDANGIRTQRIVEAPSLAVAKSLVRQDASIVVNVRQLGLIEKASDALFQRRKRLGSGDLQRFCHMLSAYLKAGIPIQESLRLLGESAPELSSLANTTRQNLANGQSLNAALENSGYQLPAGFLSLVRAGSESGKLDQILENEAEREKTLIEIRRDFWSSLIYPIVLITMSVLVVLFMLGAIVPQIKAGMPVEAIARAPMMSQLIFSASDLLDTLATPLGLTLFAIAFLLALVLIVANWQHVISIILALPGIRSISRSLRAATFAHSLGMMLESGVRLEVAWRLAVDTVHDHASQTLLRRAGERILQGQPMATAISESRTMPPDVVSTFALGERTGTLPRLLKDIAQLHSGEALARLRKLSGIAVPAIILLSGILVGGFAIAMMTTIQSVNQIYGG